MNRRKNAPQQPSHPSDSTHSYSSINPKPKHSSNQLYFIQWTIFICIIIGLFILAHLYHIHLPKPLDPNNDNTQFSENRATPLLHQLSDIGPKPFGSPGADAAVDMLQKEVKALKKFVEKGPNKLDIEMQYPSSCFSVPKFDVDGFGMCYKNVSNLIVRLTPRDKLPTKTSDEGALLLNCHFDSWPTSPAGSDDLASCVILLELIRILGDPSASPLKHDLIFLFNGAEEAGLLASHGFITQHNERHRIKGFVNLEASGSGGREILFQSGPFSQWMLDAYLNAAPYPHCSVIGQEVFQSGIVPSDTDFRIFRDHGKISGLDFAFAQNAYWWHTEFDESRRITKGSIQRAGENVLATLKYLLNQDSFEAAESTKTSIFVFFDFLGIITISYSYTTAWIFNILAAAAVFITIKRRKADFDTYKNVTKRDYLTQLGISLVIYIGIYAIIGIFMKFVICFLGEYFDAKLLWLTKHSAVFSLMVIPVAFIAFTAFSFVINFSNDLQHSILFAWSFFDVHNIIFLIILWIITAFKSASGFLFFVMLIPTIVDAIIRSVFPTLSQTFSSNHHAYLILPTFLPGFLTLYYILEVTLSTFIPILGRSKGDTDFLVLIIAIYSIFSTFFSIIPLLAFTNKKSLHYLRIIGLVITVILLVDTVLFVKPYKYNDEYPTTRRTQFYHVRSRVISKDFELVESNQQLLAIAQDNRKIYDIPFVGADPEFKEVNCSGKGRYCNLPYFFPTPDRLGPNMIRSKLLQEDKSMEYYEAQILLKSKALDSHGRLRYEFLIKGSDQISVTYEAPETANSIGWRLTDSPSKEFVSNSTFIFLSCGGENCGEWQLEIIFNSMDQNESIEVMVSSHTLHGPKMYSETLKKMHEKIRKNRESGDWRWAMTASSWTVDLLRQKF